MTCIVGYVENKTVYIGADSCGSNGHSYSVIPRSKLFKVRGRFLFGCTTSYRMIDVLEHSFNPPDLNENYDPKSYMRRDFVNVLRECFKNNGILSKENETERGGNFLVGFDGNLFEIQPDFSVLSCPDWGSSVGSGEEAAAAVLYHERDKKIKAKDRVLNALKAAEGTITTVKGPFEVQTIGSLEWKKPLAKGK